MRRSAIRPARVAAIALVLAPIVAISTASSSRSPRAPDPHGTFRGECGDCHGPETWKPARISARFDHGRFGFPLEGAHAAASCMACHTSLDFRQEAQRCVGCHTDVHRGELGVDCARCHTARSFIDRAAMLRAHQASRFPLTGGHVALACEDCHRSVAPGHLQFVGREAECVSCHRADYQAARTPDHAAGGFSFDCADCHTSATWHAARFDHALTAFPLTGAHRGATCAACHGDGAYRGVPTACASCHQSDFDATTNPSHTALGFSTECQTCHSTTAWAGATFDHDAQNFPIYSGVHARRWADCATCHVNRNDYRQFTCFSCHPHSDRTRTDEKHREVSGYAYDSQACYTCHPRGRK